LIVSDVDALRRCCAGTTRSSRRDPAPWSSTSSFTARRHSFKNRTGSLVQPEKTGTRASTGYLSALDQLRNRARINRSKHGSTAGFVLNQTIPSDRLINLSDGKSLSAVSWARTLHIQAHAGGGARTRPVGLKLLYV
jgi:hypothetical protein